jgi:membrane-associated phospholipid phosphatase/diacylglycerol kinase family enzyme
MCQPARTSTVEGVTRQHRTGRNLITAFDHGTMRRVAVADSWLLDVIMPRLSRLADHGVLWIGLGAGLWAAGDRGARRGVWRGLGSLAVASLAANVVGKGLAARARPVSQVPLGRRPAQAPWTSSFPSGHAASAAAFAAGLALEKPSLSGPATVLALAVAASRVVTGVHYPSDVLAGLAIGAASASATLYWWPRRPAVPAAAIRPPQQAPTAPAGHGLVLVVNRSAGSASPRLVRWLRAELPRARIVEARSGQDLAARLREAATRARILGVAGGDGSISAASGVALHQGLPLLVIPAGTFNHFAADLGIQSAAEAVAALRSGEAVLVDVSVAGSRPFVNTASIGIYTDLIRIRERLEPRLGRRAGVILALAYVLHRGRPHELVLNGERQRLWVCFAGNCGYEPAGMAPAYRPDLTDGCLDIRVVGDAWLARSRLVASAFTGTLARCRVYHAWRAPALDLAVADGAGWLSCDGEVTPAGIAVRLSKHPRRLLVYRQADPPRRGN